MASLLQTERLRVSSSPLFRGYLPRGAETRKFRASSRLPAPDRIVSRVFPSPSTHVFLERPSVQREERDTAKTEDHRSGGERPAQLSNESHILGMI